MLSGSSKRILLTGLVGLASRCGNPSYCSPEQQTPLAHPPAGPAGSNMKMTAIQKAAKSKGYKIFNTKSHAELLGMLDGKMRRLVKNGFVEDTCAHSAVIKGPAGIGKSYSSLKAFTELELYPEVICLYINCAGAWGSEHPLQEGDVVELIEMAVKKRNIHIPERIRGDSADANLIQALEAAGKYVLLVVDEFEELYRVGPGDSPINQQRSASLRSSLHALRWLAEQTSGRFLVVMCGSSASAIQLISNMADLKEFPGQESAARLNGTKFSTYVLPVATCKEVASVQEMLGDMGISASIEEARLVAFGIGSIARQVKLFVEAMEEGMSAGDAFAYARWRRKDAAAGLPAIHMVFHKALLKRMREKNKALLEKLCDAHGVLDGFKVVTMAWEKDFLPLTRMEGNGVWADIRHEHPDSFARIYVETSLGMLQDLCLLQLEYRSQCCYPICLADLALDTASPTMEEGRLSICRAFNVLQEMRCKAGTTGEATGSFAPQEFERMFQQKKL